MLFRAWFPVVVLSVLTLVPLSGRADENQPSSQIRAEIEDMEFEVEKREMAVKMAELGIKEAEIALERIEVQRSRQPDNSDVDVLGVDRKAAQLHLEMRTLVAATAKVDLEQVRARLNRLQGVTQSATALEGPVQVEIIKDNVLVKGRKQEDIDKVVTLIGELEVDKKPHPPIDAKLAAKIDQKLKERRDILRQSVEVMEELFRNTRGNARSVIEATESLIDAELDLAKDRTERIVLREKRVENSRKLEELVKAQHQAAQGSQADVLAAVAARVKAEIELLRERGDGE